MDEQEVYKDMNAIAFRKKTKAEIHSSMNSFCNKLLRRELSIHEFEQMIVHRLNAHIEYTTSVSSKRIIIEIKEEFEKRSSNKRLLRKFEYEKRYWLTVIAKDCIGKIIEELSADENLDNSEEI